VRSSAQDEARARNRSMGFPIALLVQCPKSSGPTYRRRG
jgi:hypothetical protein